MKKLNLLSFTLCVLCAFVVDLPAQDFKPVHPGVEYAHVDTKIGSDPLKINLLRLDLTKVRLDVHHAFDKAIGLETTSSIAKRHGAAAAINAGFFRLDKSEFAGDAAGLLKIDKKILSESTNHRATLLINNHSKVTEVRMSNLTTNLLLLMRPPRTDRKRMVVKTLMRWVPTGINRERKADDLIIFTPEFGGRTLTITSGLEITVSRDKVIGISASNNSAIPADGFVLSASGSYVDQVKGIIRGDGIIFLHRETDGQADSSRVSSADIPPKEIDEDITNGVPQLIKNGKIDITWEQEKASKSFAETRHPRTAVAKLKDGKFLMMTVDGRQPGISVGMNLQELAEYLLSLGAVDAMNLDGGGSTTMFLDGKVVNTPSDKEGERKVGDAILVTLRKKK